MAYFYFYIHLPELPDGIDNFKCGKYMLYVLSLCKCVYTQGLGLLHNFYIHFHLLQFLRLILRMGHTYSTSLWMVLT